MNIAIFASGSGTNAEAIIRYFKNKGRHKVSLIVCNNPGAFVLKRAADHSIPHLLITKTDFSEDSLLAALKRYHIDFIVLAGFLWKIPDFLLKEFPDCVVNIHPALLPLYGGKGMYGMRIHQAVLEAKDKESGITIHYVNEHYDEGRIIFQKKCPVDAKDTPESLAEKIHALEHEYYPPVIEEVLNKKALQC
jgi:phosphoribosylglycinamide formyltransferase-1